MGSQLHTPLPLLQSALRALCAAQLQLLRSLATDNSSVLRGEGVSQLSPPGFAASQAAMQQLLTRLEQLTAAACQGGGAQAVKRHKDRSKLPPRDRIGAILDTGSPFLELSHLAGHGLYGELFRVPGLPAAACRARRTGLARA